MADRTVYFAKIARQPRLFDRDFARDVTAALDPRHTVTRYGRTWRFSRTVTLEAGHVAGKLGFVRTSQAAETTYDEETQDFVTTVGVANEGSFSMFVIDPRREIIAFEERPPDIRLQSFLGAFRALLVEADFPASVELLRDQSGFREWARTVDRVIRVRAVIHTPNPGWNEDAGAFREVVEQANAERAEVVAVADEDASLDPDAQWIQGALRQIAEQGHGKLTADGLAAEAKQRWESGTQLQTATIRDEDATSPEGVWAWLTRRVRAIYGG